MNIVVTQTAINASVSDQNISTSLAETSISVSATISNVSASLTQTQINASISQGQAISLALYQTPVNVTVSSNGGGGNNHDPVTLGTANGLSLSGQVLSLALSTSGTVGALSAVDWITFNNKLSDAPSDGQVYGRKNAVWVPATGTGGGGSSLPVIDTTSIVMGSVDSTKQLRFEVDGFSAGATRVLTPPNQDITLAGQNFLNVFTVNQQMNAHAAIGANSNVANPGQLLFPGDVYQSTFSVEETFSTNPAGINYVEGITNYLILNPSANSSVQSYALDCAVATDPSNTRNIGNMWGLLATSWHRGSGTVASMGGLQFSTTLDAGSAGTVNGISALVGTYSDATSAVRGIYIYADYYGGATLPEFYGQHLDLWMGATSTTAYGIRISLQDDGGSATNAYGLYVDDVTFGATDYAMYTNAGRVSLGGNLFLRAIKSGATQVAAGALANEVWKTSGHATLPNNVLMIGV